MRGGDLPFLPVFHAHIDMSDSEEGWRERFRRHVERVRSSRKGMSILGFLSFLTLILVFVLFRPKKIVYDLPSPGFESTSLEWKTLTHLIVLPGHGIQWCTEQGKSPKDESCWYLQSFQHGQVPLFLAHIRRAIQEAANDPKSLLVFSGGQTRPGVGLRTEAQSYFSAAEKLGYFFDFDGTNVYDRSVSEDFAKDSLENLMFSVCRFKQIVGHYPRKITVVGFPFKAARFIELHRKAINFPLENFKYIGVEVSGIRQDHIKDSAYDDFKEDLYGCGRKLKDKRMVRNPYHHFNAYKDTCPDMLHYLNACDDL